MTRRTVLWTLGGAALAVTLGSLAWAAARKPPRPGGTKGAGLLRAETLEPRFERLKAISAPKAPAQPGDWLASFPEPGQSFAEYRDARPTRPTAERRTIYFRPIGPFTGANARLLDATLDYTGRFFGLPVKALDPLPLREIPSEARRLNPITDQMQLLTTYVMQEKLQKAMPEDALALIGLTTVDLYPEPSWNFVFGEALPDAAVGIWSTARFGDPATPEGFRKCLRRTLQTATHEIGHLFGLEHCVAWECQMNGSNSLGESDRAPLDLCPACLQKLAWFTGADPVQRLRSLAQFAREQGLEADAALLEKNAALVAQIPAP